MSSLSLDLLPSNASELERALAALSARIDAIDPDVIATVWNAWECPSALLPVLAWAMSVDFWQDDWSEATQRQAIADAPAYHRIKGTVEAVRRVLSLFGCRAVIEEWFEQVPVGRRGTFKVTAYVVETLADQPIYITPTRIRDAIKAVKAAKPKSRAFSFQMAVGVTSRSVATGGVAEVTYVGLGPGTDIAKSGRAVSVACGGVAAVDAPLFGSVSTRRQCGFVPSAIGGFSTLTYVEFR